MKRKLMPLLCGALALGLAAGAAEKGKGKDKGKGSKLKETALFKVDVEGMKIAGVAGDLKGRLGLALVSVTTDQAFYRPDEEVTLKVLMPLNPSAKVEASLLGEGKPPEPLGKLGLDENGLLVRKILPPKGGKSGAGLYRVVVKSADGKREGEASFEVTDGAVSFIHAFEKVEDPKQLPKVKGGWFLGDAHGVGLQWGSGLNIKNEIEVMDQPYSGTLSISFGDCYGEGPGLSKTLEVKNGLLEAVIETGGAQEDVCAEFATGKGSVRYAFPVAAAQVPAPIAACAHMGRSLFVTLDPGKAEPTVFGAALILSETAAWTNDPIKLSSPRCDQSGKITMTVKRELLSPRVFVLYPDPKGQGVIEKEVAADPKWEQEKIVSIDCPAPVSLVAVGGFLPQKSEFYEGWSLALKPSSLDAQVSAPASAKPLDTVTLALKTVDKGSGKPVAAGGILEVFDSRVSSESVLAPLRAQVESACRGIAGSLSAWKEIPAGGKKGKKVIVLDEIKIEAPTNPPAVPVGEAKVIYRGAVATGAEGTAEVKVALPQQKGTWKVRFTAAKGAEFAEKTVEIVVK